MGSHSFLLLLAVVLLVAVEVAVGATIAAAAGSTHWNYRDQDAWNDIPGAFCDGQRQSPINIITSNVNTNYYPYSLSFSNSWNYAMDFEKHNDGHSVRYTPINVDATVKTWRGTYKLTQFHVHWGKDTNEGSEHLVNGWQASAEFHFVHEKTTGSVSDGDHYSVLGVRAVECDGHDDDHNHDDNRHGHDDDRHGHDDDRHDHNDDNHELWDKLMPPGTEYDAKATVTGVYLRGLFPQSFDYYYYAGSLTTPTCDETVQWFVFTNTIKVPSQYLQALRKVKDEEGNELQFNFRDTQPLNGRTVYWL